MTADSVASRVRWFVLALSPLLAIRIAPSPIRVFALLCISLSLAFVLGLAAQSLRRQPLRQAWLDEGNWSVALLLPLWFGAALPFSVMTRLEAARVALLVPPAVITLA